MPATTVQGDSAASPFGDARGRRRTERRAARLRARATVSARARAGRDERSNARARREAPSGDDEKAQPPALADAKSSTTRDGARETARAMSNEDASDVEIAVSFVTRLPEEFRVSESAIEVPGRLTRYGLSEVVNHLLGATTPTPFDFLIDGTLLRTSLAKLALRLGKSAEATLVVEYVPALGPPTAAETTKCEAWVSSIDGSWAKAVVTGSFDGKARLWSPVGKLLCELEGAEERVCSVSLAPPSAGADAENACVVLAASADHTLRSYAVTLTGKKCELGEQRVFKGHEGTVTDVASAYGARLFASCSVDCTARVWKIDGGESANEKVTKKRRTSKKSEATDDDAMVDDASAKIGLGEELVLRGHTDQVRAVSWESPQVLWTGAYDNTIRAWDVETGEEKESHHTNSSVHTLDVSRGGSRFAFGGSDRLVNVWDPRESASAKACLKLKSHEVSLSSCVLSLALAPVRKVSDEHTFDSRHSCVRAQSITLIFY